MTTPFWCLGLVALFPYLLAGIGGYLRIRELGSLDNNHPRIQALELRGIAARAYAAQLNAWEALTLFGVAVIVAHLAGADPEWSATLAVVFVMTRVVHAALYLANLATLRSLVFFGSLACIVSLFVAAAQA